jgi:hypothetical protein
MIMTAHWYLSMKQQALFFGCCSRFDQDFFLDGGADKNGSAAPAPGAGVIKSVFIFDPQRPRHERIPNVRK